MSLASNNINIKKYRPACFNGSIRNNLVTFHLKKTSLDHIDNNNSNDLKNDHFQILLFLSLRDKS